MYVLFGYGCKLLIYRLIYMQIPTPTYCPDLWEATERMRSLLQAGKISFVPWAPTLEEYESQ